MITQPIDTQRLRIRPFRQEDWRAVYAYVSDPIVATYTPDGPMTAEQTQVYIDKQISADKPHAYALLLKATNDQADEQFIGHMVFHPWFEQRTYEIGWTIHPAYQRQGYATEAAAALLHYGFAEMKLHRIIATCQPENVASYRVMEKIGMRREGHFQQCIYRGDDQWWDEYFYAMLAQEWFKSE
ncbi:MAG: GNAT family N-acetyltransferase [Caldilineaceae bacterium]